MSGELPESDSNCPCRYGKIALHGKGGDKLWIKGGKMLFSEQAVQLY
jgi:hypothetical protein